MRFFASLVVLGTFASGALAGFGGGVPCSGPNARVMPPKGAIVVDGTGKHPGSYKTVSEGVANIPNTTAEHTLFVYPGVYQEQVVVPKFNGPVVLQGNTCNTQSYAHNQVTIIQGLRK